MVYKCVCCYLGGVDNPGARAAVDDAACSALRSGRGATALAPARV